MMLWGVGSGLLIAWLILFLVHPSGWVHLLLLGGITVLVVQTAAYRKTKAARNIRN
jgi:energy-converting hydrogenase Eha subunit G